MTKKVQCKEEYFIEFTDEELEKLNWSKGQKLSIDLNGDDSFTLKPFEKIELDLSEFDRSTLETWIKISAEKDISVNQVVSDLLEEKLNEK